MRMGLAQCGVREDRDLIATLETYAYRAAEQGVDMLVFPEALMSAGDSVHVPDVASVAQRHGIWLVVVLYEPSDSGLPYNTAMVFDDTGEMRGTYRKCHLYDAHNERESLRMRAGDAMAQPIQTPFCILGVGICYDLRFPELARTLAVEGCDVVVFPAAWHDGPQKAEHWQTLLRARAIENECFVVGVCRAGKKYVGRSLVSDPLGRVLACGPVGSDNPAGEDLLVCDLDLAQVEQARRAMPVLDHRRPDLYWPL